MQEKITLNREQAHIMNEFFRKFGSEHVWKIDDKIYELVNNILAAHIQVEEEIGMADNN